MKSLKWELLRKMLGGFLLVSLCLIGFSKPFQDYLHIPKNVTIFQGDEINFAKAAEVTANINQSMDHVSVQEAKQSLAIKGKKVGQDEILLELAGLPIKKVDVKVLKNFRVIPGGQSIGVKLNSKGVLVVGHHLVETKNGKVSPGDLAGIKVGDIITKLNGQTIEKMSDVAPFVQEAGEKGTALKVTIQRDSGKFNTEIEPQKDESENIYKLGLYITGDGRSAALGCRIPGFAEARGQDQEIVRRGFAGSALGAGHLLPHLGQRIGGGA
ncbi:MAG: PDZ domain-containing protein, partial [Heyndrickxia sp.]